MHSDSSSAQAALADLCRNYWYPIYAFIRRSGKSPEDAEDLTQGFWERFLEKHYLDDVDRGKGRFRSFLLASVCHFLSNERDKQQRLKRGGAFQFVPLAGEATEQRYRCEPSHDVTPENLFDRSWAAALLEHTLDRLRREYRAAGKGALFGALQVYLDGEKGRVPYAQICRDLAMGESAVKMSVLRLRRRFGELLREEIASTVADPAEVETEIRALFSALS